MGEELQLRFLIRELIQKPTACRCMQLLLHKYAAEFIFCCSFFLQKTSDGQPKVLDLIDTTGSGDVDTSCVRKTVTETDREIVSLNGHVLKIPDEWCNPTREWHVGVKSEHDLLPPPVKTRAQVCTCIV